MLAYIRQIGVVHYCTLCGEPAEETWGECRPDYICRCEGARSWYENKARKKQVADKIRRLELIDELKQINMRLGLDKN
jgi:hypothetical protein